MICNFCFHFITFQPSNVQWLSYVPQILIYWNASFCSQSVLCVPYVSHKHRKCISEQHSSVGLCRGEEGYVLRKPQRSRSHIDTWCERWNIEIDKDKTQATYFHHTFRPLEPHRTLIGWNTLFVNHVKYHRVIFDNRIIRRWHTEMTLVNDFKIFIIKYSVLRTKHFSANFNPTLHNYISNDLCIPRLQISSRHLSHKIEAPAKEDYLHHWKLESGCRYAIYMPLSTPCSQHRRRRKQTQ